MKGKRTLSDFVRAILEDRLFSENCGEEKSERKNARFYRNHFNKGYQRILGEFTISSEEKMHWVILISDLVSKLTISLCWLLNG